VLTPLQHKKIEQRGEPSICKETMNEPLYIGIAKRIFNKIIKQSIDENLEKKVVRHSRLKMAFGVTNMSF